MAGCILEENNNGDPLIFKTKPEKKVFARLREIKYDINQGKCPLLNHLVSRVPDFVDIGTIRAGLRRGYPELLYISGDSEMTKKTKEIRC